MASDSLTATVAACEVVLFDFDGPICDVFSGLPAPEVADQLSSVIAAHDAELAAKAAATDDPIEVLRISQQGGPALLASVEKELIAAELSAVAVAGDPVEGAVDALRAACESGREVVAVSNNSAECVREFLGSHGLLDLVRDVVGRPKGRPDLMKPDPYPISEAIRALAAVPARCVLVGDSVTDVEASHAANTMAIGFANKPGKAAALSAAGAGAVITNMRALAEALRE
ncbi:HAD family hydrolase [Streptomyces sp. NPDC057654]|uniref:HAD family hydrolase n=1 Tax=Streptomyces sp. NPDC057654 TaxID=3346196 RepID=UPI0036CB5360